MRVHLGTTIIRELPLGAPASASNVARRYQRTVRLAIDKPGPLVVSVLGETTLDPVVARRGVKPFAFTNPIWLVRPGELPPQPRHRVETAPLEAPHEHAHPHPHPGDPSVGGDPGDARVLLMDASLPDASMTHQH